MNVEVTSYKPFGGDEYNYFDGTSPVVVLGSINLCQQIQRTKPWVPGPIANFRNFDCMVYYAYYGKYLLNRDYIILPLGDLENKYDSMYQLTKSWFIRPTGGAKKFTGQVLDWHNFQREQDLYGPPELPIVVAPAVNVVNEYRLFCSKETVLTGSLYRDAEGELCYRKIDMSIESDKQAVDFAQSILNDVVWRPDPIFTMDIGYYGVRPYLIEINSLSCSGWYNADISVLIREIAKVAEQDWKDIYEIN